VSDFEKKMRFCEKKTFYGHFDKIFDKKSQLSQKKMNFIENEAFDSNLGISPLLSFFRKIIFCLKITLFTENIH